MPLNWGGITVSGGNMSEADQTLVRQSLDRFADNVARILDNANAPREVSPIFRQWGLVVVWDAEKLVALFTKPSGMRTQQWIDERSQIIPVPTIIDEITTNLSVEIVSTVVLPIPTATPGEQHSAAAMHHLAELERASALGRLGDLRGLEHLEPALREFIADHPDPERSAFVMMRFRETEQMNSIHAAIRDTLEPLGFHAIRADDRDYTGELWTNVQVCMTGCSLGIAVFEDIDDRDFNPNVSLELGYMLARHKRCLILKERRLPALPADVVHRLYKDFDMFKIGETISHQVDRWLRIDLRAT